MTRRRAAALAAAPLLTLGLLAGCSSEEGSDRPAAESTIPASEDFNDADVRFATDMVPHHAQALQMVDMTLGRKTSPEFAELAEQIRAAQAPEIEQMVDWLGEWDQPVPETSRDHMNAEGHGDSGDDHGDSGGSDGMEGMEGMEGMPGMMSADELTELEQADGPGFEERWLEAMIEHHEGAVEMAETVIADGEHAGTRELAESIRESQTAEIEQMERMLG